MAGSCAIRSACKGRDKPRIWNYILVAMADEPKMPKSAAKNISAEKAGGCVAENESSQISSANDSTSVSPAAKKSLTSEEQMALYEEHLKENDWGHQPC